ncbi:MAG: UDP-3-O-acyl-N-acetylglucosamine deacetylase [Desulfamplus sp.]|nr:UDP-3-O-acyl-N-acetylglucosamine deacetylase [Desulfamplus sp.]MBF0210175.1 UDP-3-O-acyl-N-acetylglucosamine deacetylase [Desulfamplus sp.]MBF0243271.1 UDP-3-O-acyl-N-acetylglucosamine deacetylase [Desulfamplus sp.]
MEKYYPQKSIEREVSCSGIGVHSGRRTSITIKPAPENHGIRFRRTDLPGTPDIPALFKMVVDTSLATVIGSQGVIVSTIEHLMAAFTGLAIDNALVEIDGYEMPIMDGSAKAFAKIINQAGIVEQKMPRWFFVVIDEITINDNDKYVTVTPHPHFKISCSIHFPNPIIGNQELSFDLSPENFTKEICSARTFGFVKDLQYLKMFNLGRGGSLDNAIVVDNDKVLNESGLRYPDEFVRHKLLDSLGDFALLGMPILGHIQTHKSGHDLNHRFINKFLAQKGSWETRPVLMH